MTQYSNPKIPEGINVSKTSPLVDFFIMVAGFILLVGAALVALSLAAGLIAKRVPFGVEQRFFDSHLQENDWFGDEPGDENHQRIQRYLQTLADELAVAQGLPEDMPITVHYIDDGTVNAFATLAGHVYIHRGLLDKLSHENALSMVMAHEIAHIKNRDPLVATGRGVAVMLAMGTMIGVDSDAAAAMFSNTATLTSLSFNRQQERRADSDAIATLENHYGHVAGADQLFEVLMEEHDGVLPDIELLSTHPNTQKRIDKILDIAASQPADAQLTPLPEFITRLE